MDKNKHAARSLERQYLRNVRKYDLSVAEVNIALSKIHQAIMSHIDLEAYRLATEYIHQYISYTSVWNLKFVANLESPEVALLQIFHLNHIFKNEPADRFKKERAILAEQEQRFFDLKPYKPEHVEKRRQKMMDYIESNS